MNKLGAFDAYVQDEEEKAIRLEYSQYRLGCIVTGIPEEEMLPFDDWLLDKTDKEKGN